MTWQHYFNRARRSNGPVGVNKQDVGAMPFGFESQGITVNGIWGVYERHEGFEKIRIYELPGQYLITVSNTAADNPRIQQPTGINTRQLQPASSGSQQGNNWKGLAGLGLLLGGAALAVGKAFSDSQQASAPDPEKAHRVFISHSWRYEDDFEEVKSLLDDAYDFEYFDHSVSSDEPLDAQLPNHLRKKFRDQIRSTSVVLVLAGMYVAHSDSIQDELEIAADMGKPIIGVIPDGNDQVPNIVEQHATELVEANGRQILDAIKRYA